MRRSSEPSPEPSPSSGEHKASLDAIASQLERLNQREGLRSSDLERLRRLAAMQSAQGSPYQSPTKGIRQEFIDEIEMLRKEKRDLQMQNCELEVQIQDAAQSIEGFSTAIEKLEDGYKAKEDTWKRQIADLQQECDGLAGKNRQLQAQVTKNEQLKSLLSQKEQSLQDIREKFDAFKAQATEVDQERQKLHNTEDTLRATQAALEKAEALNKSLATQLDSLTIQHQEAMHALEAKTRQMMQYEATNRPQGQSVLVRTLRDEVRLLKGKLEEQFREEKSQLIQRIQTLEAQVSSGQTTIRLKEDAIRQFQKEAAERDQVLATLNEHKRMLEVKIERTERELQSAHKELQQLHECRGFLGENIELGFKELLQQDGQTQALELELLTTQTKLQSLSLEHEALKSESSSYQVQCEELREQLKSLRSQLEAQETQSNKLRTEALRLPELEVKLNEQKLLLEKSQKQEGQLRHELNDLKNELNQYSDYALMKERLHLAEQRLASFQHAKDDAKSRDTQMKQLLQRLEVIGERNLVLDDALKRAMEQSKKDQTDMIALRARIKSSKQKVDSYDSMKQALEAAQDQIREALTMKHVLKQQVDTLKRQVDELQAERRQHENAAKVWKRTQEQMQSIVESHTKELVNEIESLQRRYAKATKKYQVAVDARRDLELKIQEKNSTIAKLHQILNQAPQSQHRRPLSPISHDDSHHHEAQTSSLSSSPTAKNSSTLRLLANPAQEMESLLKNLEQISQFITLHVKMTSGSNRSELESALRGQFGDLADLQETASRLVALQNKTALRVDTPAIVVFGERPECKTLDVLCAAANISLHHVGVSTKDDGAFSSEQFLQAQSIGRDKVKNLIQTQNLLGFVAQGASDEANTVINLLNTATASTTDLAALFASCSPLIAAICGGIIEASTHKVPIVIDGHIPLAAALCARALVPSATQNSIFYPSNILDNAVIGPHHGMQALPFTGKYPLGVSVMHLISQVSHAAQLINALDLKVSEDVQEEQKGPAAPVFIDPELPEPPELRIFLTSVMFLTRLPAYMIIPDLDHNVRELVPSFCYFPFIGWWVGLFAAFFLWLGSFLFHSSLVAVIVSTFASVWLTGCFHEDGVADTFDSFGGGWSKNDILRIMKDSRLGTYGCMGLLLMTTLKFAILQQLILVKDIPWTCCALVAGHILGRYSSLFILQFYPYVEDERDPKGPLYNGIGNNLHLLTHRRVWGASIFTALSLILLLGFTLGTCVFSVGLLISYLAGQYFAGFLGGVIGDCLGCANQVVEVGVYLVVVFILTRDPITSLQSTCLT